MPRINDDLTIDDSELHFEFARSSGPGGQHVNKVETKVRLLFDVVRSPSLTDGQRRLIEDRLATRMTKAGLLHVTSQRHRSREANRRATVERFAELVNDALQQPEPRQRTKKPRAARKRRLDDKRRHSLKKAMRSRPDEEY
ncbi:MAG: alternative ribosome rescue aminoacyl-tRNA hydrolase ArfB [Holophagae bacterium]|jgi:ribosome-associated protein